MTGLGIEAALEGALAVFVTGVWWRVGHKKGEYIGWRYKAPVAGLALSTLTLAVQLMLTGLEAHFGSLAALDEASLHWRWSHLLDGLWLCSFFATGLLPFCGLVLAAVGKGRPRLPGVLSSALVLGTFLFNLFLAVNSFH
jgi:hypothetical protein